MFGGLLKISFNDRLEVQGSSALWRASEKFTCFGNKSYKFNSKINKHITLESSSYKSNKLKLIFRIAFCFTIAFPLTIAALITKAVYRKKYHFQVISRQNTPAEKVNDASNLPKDYSKPNAPLPNPVPDPLGTHGVSPPPASAQPAVKTAYKIDDVFARIHQAKKDGYKVALFMGRGNLQTMPEEQGWKWFSLDRDMEEGKNDHHLAMDFNDREAMKKIQKLFNKVVVDFSTLKFVDSPLWIRLKALLVPEPDSELITEASVGYGFMYISEPDFSPMDGTMNLPMSMLNDKKAQSEQKVELNKKIKEHLIRHFNQVEMKTDVYPYRSQEEEQRTEFWILKSPKTLIATL